MRVVESTSGTDAGHNSVALPRVTIMIPTYNQAGMILDAVDSALAQDYPNLEVIVADDASLDDTQSIVATRKDPRLRYHRNPVNLGRVANYRNTLLNLATGDWVVNLDGDDYYTDVGFVSAAVNLASRDANILAVLADARTHGTARKHPATVGCGWSIISGIEMVDAIASGRLRFFHLASLFKRDAALKVGFYRFDGLAADIESISRLALRGKVGLLKREVGVWRPNESSASNKACVEEMIVSLETWPRIYSDAANLGMDACRASTCRNRMLGLTAYCDVSRLLSAGDYKGSVVYLDGFWRTYGLAPMVVLMTRWRLYYRAISGKWIPRRTNSMRG